MTTTSIWNPSPTIDYSSYYTKSVKEKKKKRRRN
jgi:hypothetical protein